MAGIGYIHILFLHQGFHIRLCPSTLKKSQGVVDKSQMPTSLLPLIFGSFLPLHPSPIHKPLAKLTFSPLPIPPLETDRPNPLRPPIYQIYTATLSSLNISPQQTPQPAALLPQFFHTLMTRDQLEYHSLGGTDDDDQQLDRLLATPSAPDDLNNVFLTIHDSPPSTQLPETTIDPNGSERVTSKRFYTSYDPRLLASLSSILFVICAHWAQAGYIPPYSLSSIMDPDLSIKTTPPLIFLTFSVMWWVQVGFVCFSLAHNYAIRHYFPLLSRKHFRGDLITIRNNVDIDNDSTHHFNFDGDQQKLFMQTKFSTIGLLNRLGLTNNYPRLAVLGYLAMFMITLIHILLNLFVIILYSDRPALIFEYSFAARGEALPEDFAKLQKDWVSATTSLSWGCIMLQCILLAIFGLFLRRAFYRDRVLAPHRYAVLTNLVKSVKKLLF